MIQLAYPTPPDWAPVALRDFDAFLLDHASCERKASAVGLSFVVRYPDRARILEPMIQFAREELEHFHQVFKIVAQRGLQLAPDTEDEYVHHLMKLVRSGREERFLDRLLVSGLIEARGTERMERVVEHLEDPALKTFYQRLARAESRHKDFFVEMALHYFSPTSIEARLAELVKAEADIVRALPDIVRALPYRSALH
jgi:tRNA 2-(methylsulfanyl)-N6-isopentenyladenosine37 hydroxylase